jgi:hypothetical protein
MVKPRAKRKRGLSNVDTYEEEASSDLTNSDQNASSAASGSSAEMSSSLASGSSSVASSLSTAQLDAMSIATYPRTHIRDLLRYRLYSVSSTEARSAKVLSALKKEEEPNTTSRHLETDYVNVPQVPFGYLESFATNAEIASRVHLDPAALQVPGCYSKYPCSSSTPQTDYFDSSIVAVVGSSVKVYLASVIERAVEKMKSDPTMPKELLPRHVRAAMAERGGGISGLFRENCEVDNGIPEVRAGRVRKQVDERREVMDLVKQVLGGGGGDLGGGKGEAGEGVERARKRRKM